MTDKVVAFSKKWRMELNLKKSEVMIVRPAIKMPIPLHPSPTVALRYALFRLTNT